MLSDLIVTYYTFYQILGLEPEMFDGALMFLTKNFWAITIPTTVGGAIATWIWRFRPKAENPKKLAEYVDDVRRRRIEYWEYELNWGRIPFWKKITLAEIFPGATVDVTIIPPDGIEIKVSQVNWQIAQSKYTKKIILNNKKYFEERYTKKIRILIENPISNEYRKNINVGEYEDFIELENNNPFEIKNYLMELPPSINLKNLKNAYNHIDSIRFTVTLPKFVMIINDTIESLRRDGLKMELLIAKIPSKEGRKIEKIRIPVS